MKMTEMSKLFLLLADADIPFETHEIFGTMQICYPTIKNRICDAICHEFSYGHEEGLLEIMGLVDPEICDDVDDVEGYLTAEEVFARIKADYEKRQGA